MVLSCIKLFLLKSVYWPHESFIIVIKLPCNDFQSLRGPRGGMIFYKKDTIFGVDLESAINNAVFPGLQVRCYCFLNSPFSPPVVYLYLA